MSASVTSPVARRQREGDGGGGQRDPQNQVGLPSSPPEQDPHPRKRAPSPGRERGLQLHPAEEEPRIPKPPRSGDLSRAGASTASAAPLQHLYVPCAPSVPSLDPRLPPAINLYQALRPECKYLYAPEPVPSHLNSTQITGVHTKGPSTLRTRPKRHNVWAAHTTNTLWACHHCSAHRLHTAHTHTKLCTAHRHHPCSIHSPGLPQGAAYTPVSVSRTRTHIPDHRSGVPKLAPGAVRPGPMEGSGRAAARG